MSWDDFERLLVWLVYEAARDEAYYANPLVQEKWVYALFKARLERWPVGPKT